MVKSQPLRPSRRAIQAEQTRHDILQVARRHFAERGYAGTSLRAIASDAGVSVQTIYDSVGSKSDLVRSLNDLIDREAEVAAIAAEVGFVDDPHQLATVPARITRTIIERCGDIVRAGIDAARAEDELRGLVEEGSRRHRLGTTGLARRLDALGALRDGLDIDAAAVTIGLVSDPRTALVMTDVYGLTPDQVEEWITDAVRRLVLR
ncbi:MAG: TetR family transcriptional regulator [Ilumatobacteraceae bacterium]